MIFSSNSVLRLARTAAVAAAFAALTGTAAGVLAAAGAPAGSHVRQGERTVAALGDPDWNSTGSECKVCTER
ncbi:MULTISPECIES: hypothetical protein [unclassified Streptomyces]|uniref:hypothetical protein n=1 Tax=unclassified Streptomyces TaxID=2593676 RepID=UPI0004C7DC0D|nr:hypothetical protein [Streptomyces sp. NRRL F-2747]